MEQDRPRKKKPLKILKEFHFNSYFRMRINRLCICTIYKTGFPSLSQYSLFRKITFFSARKKNFPQYNEQCLQSVLCKRRVNCTFPQYSFCFNFIWGVMGANECLRVYVCVSLFMFKGILFHIILSVFLWMCVCVCVFACECLCMCKDIVFHIILKDVK